MSQPALAVSSNLAVGLRARERSGFQFGVFTYRPDRALLLSGDTAVRVGSRALDILGCLLERAGEVVDKQTISRRVWPGVVVEEVGLRVHLAALRKALGDGEDGARYIINVPGRGYQFVAPVDRLHGCEPRRLSDAQLLMDALNLLKDPFRLRAAIEAVDAADLAGGDIARMVTRVLSGSLVLAEQEPPSWERRA